MHAEMIRDKAADLLSREIISQIKLLTF